MVFENLISIMIGQHRGLQKDLRLTQNMSLDSLSDASNILKQLDIFKSDLTEHLKLENGVFYLELIQKMKEKNIDTTKTELFIKEMGEIVQEVMNFLDSNNSEEKLFGNKDFKMQLNEIVDVLNIRIESEEAGVYSYWGLF